MVNKIFKCPVCNIYTMKEIHCNTKTYNIRPPRYSPEDKWGKWRRIAKKDVMEN